MVFVKEVKEFPVTNKYAVMINQKIYDPNDKFYFEEDGTQV